MAAAVVDGAFGQSGYQRRPVDELDVMAPSARVDGALGRLRVADRSCRPGAVTGAGLRQRIVDIAVQEWSYFGFTVVDETRGDARPAPRRRGRRWSLLAPADTVRVADSIAGYWAVTPDGAWIIEDQNERWRRGGPDVRWRTPWSAAFVSWVMCESGLGEARFRRAVAHHTYIDQAIRARDAAGSPAAFSAYDIGEARLAPGDLVCSGRRPAYRSLAERRRQMGEGARTHCDVVVALDPRRRRLLTVGGNVRGTVGLKVLPAVPHGDGDADEVGLRPAGGRRPLFAHLKLQAPPVAADALFATPTVRAIACAGRPVPAPLVAAGLLPAAVGAECETAGPRRSRE